MSDRCQILCGDCLELLRAMPDDSCDLVFCSPPYCRARNYGIGFSLDGQDWVDWAIERFQECVRVCKGIVCWVIEGQTRNYRWGATPALFMTDLHRAGVHLRKPPIFRRVGIPGSGGPDWLRNDYEFIVCGSKGGILPWSDNTAMGHKPKWAPGGAMSHRLTGMQGKRPNGRFKTRKVMTRPRPGMHNQEQDYREPAIANPGNVICASVGGGVMGPPLIHDNEAPFPEKLAEFFVRSFCPPDGTVLDCFSGSGTTASVALQHGRRAIAIDIRESQCALTKRRIAQVQRQLI